VFRALWNDGPLRQILYTSQHVIVHSVTEWTASVHTLQKLRDCADIDKDKRLVAVNNLAGSRVDG